MSDERKDTPKFPPTIETPAAVVDLAEEMKEEADNFALAAGDGPTDGRDRIIIPKLRATGALIKQAIRPLRWLGYEIIANDLERVVEEIDELLGEGSFQNAVPQDQ